MFEIDVRLLLLFEAIYRHSNISKAAEELGIGQPAASLGLSKLRKHFDNVLFVRVGNQMQATQTAQDLLPLVTQALQHIRLVNEYSNAFNPLQSRRVFRVSMTDISHMTIVPKLVTYLQQHAPHIKLTISAIHDDTPALMSAGEIDLAIGYIPQLEARFYQQTLFRQQYRVLVRQDHPIIQGDTLSLEQYEHAHHVEVVPRGTGHYILAEALHRQRIERQVSLRLPSYLGIGGIIQETDLLATIPQRLSQILTQRGGLKTLALPFAVADYDVKQHWHERMHTNPDNKWLRQACYQLFHD